MARIRIEKKNCELVAKVRIPFWLTINTEQYDVLEQNIHMGFFKLRGAKRHKLELVGSMGTSLYERLKSPLSEQIFFFIIRKIVEFVQKMDSLGLSRANLVMDLRYIFINETTEELTLIYLPIVSPHDEVDVMAFINQIVYSTKPEGGMNYIPAFNTFLKNLKEFDAKEIEVYIQGGDKEECDENTDMSEDEKTDIASNEWYGSSKKEETELEEEEQREEMEEKTDFADDENTDMSKEEATSFNYPVLVRTLTGERIKIDKPVFRLGIEAECVDYVINNNAKVSHTHADIISRDGKYYVRDLRSKNGTYINNRVLSTEYEEEIFNGDELRLANEEFVFQVQW